MFQFAHVVLLILGLLACPMRCTGLMPGESAPGLAQNGCSCCGPVDALQPACPEGDDSRPAEPANGCSCGSCLCQGAVLTDDDSVLSLDAGETLQPERGARLGGTSSPGLSAPIACEARRPRHRCGRDARIWHESLLL